eukprot:COSAG01_NODE_7385_length_3229_cov_9.246645_1_plen_125_part_00
MNECLFAFPLLELLLGRCKARRLCLESICVQWTTASLPHRQPFAPAPLHSISPLVAQRMFLCRAVVGDWCLGRSGALTPDTKPGSLELFDTTVDDVDNPSIFVAYHDAQAYPEYLVSFKQARRH